MASGVVIGLLGLWIFLRTISSGGGGNLADWLLNLGGNSPTGPSSKQSSGQGAPSGPAPSTTPGRITTPGQTVPTVGGIGHRNIP